MTIHKNTVLHKQPIKAELCLDRINCANFYMIHSNSYTHISRGSAVHDFDLYDLTEKRIGRMQVTLSTNDIEINDSGNIGGFMLKGHESSTIIAQAGLELETLLKSHSIAPIRYTASEKSTDQIAAIKQIGGKLIGEFRKDGETYYSYEKSV